jgi:uncharacterized cupin superfamily protein
MSDASPRSPAFNPLDVPGKTGSGYPGPLKAIAEHRLKRRLGDHGGLNNFGVNMVTLPPGSGSALRHHHALQDEFIYIISGTPTLVTDAGAQLLSPGQCAAFPAGGGDGHKLDNNSGADVVYLEVGDRTDKDTVSYPDDDLHGVYAGGGFAFTKKNGDAY